MKGVVLAALVVAACTAAAAPAAPPQADVRFATFNASLNRPSSGLLTAQLADPTVDDQYRRQAKNVAEVIQRIRPDVLLINEFDPLQNGDVGVPPARRTSSGSTSSRSRRTARRRSATRMPSSPPRTRASRPART